jgi:hypothetical protein
MEWVKQSHRKSLLGQLLVDKKLISEQQLAQAIDHQRKTGQLLGDIFAEWNIISQRQVQSVLRKQRGLRLTATIATALLAPLQAYAAVVPAPVTLSSTQTSSASQRQSGLRALTEQELSETSGQGVLDDTLGEWLNLSKTFSYNVATQNMLKGQLDLIRQPNSGLKVLGDLGKLMNPVLSMLDANTTMKDVVYDTADAASIVNKDGSVTLSLPSSIGEISFQNIRVKGSTGPSFGSIDIRGIDLRGTTITVKSH